jgi:hypothetical protein
LQQGLQRIITDSLFATSSLGRPGEGSKIVIKTVAEINARIFLKLRAVVNPLKRQFKTTLGLFVPRSSFGLATVTPLIIINDVFPIGAIYQK